LEHPRTPARRPTVVTPEPLVTIDGELTGKQRALLEALVVVPSVSAAAARLSMSRSNVYASLRRVGRKVGVADVTELLRLLRAGQLTAPSDG
jgi:DNA-binding NarL/FixJ family response regulator